MEGKSYTTAPVVSSLFSGGYIVKWEGQYYLCISVLAVWCRIMDWSLTSALQLKDGKLLYWYEVPTVCTSSFYVVHRWL